MVALRPVAGQPLDRLLQLGVPINAALSWTLSSNCCGASRANCRLQDPIVPPVLPPDTLRPLQRAVDCDSRLHLTTLQGADPATVLPLRALLVVPAWAQIAARCRWRQPTA